MSPIAHRSVHHVGISVRDITEAVEFFKLLLQEEPLAIEHRDQVPFLREITGYDDMDASFAFFEVPGNGVLLELIEYRRPQRGELVDLETYQIGNTHMSLHVPDIEAEFDRLDAAGVKFRSARPVAVPDGPLVGAKFAYLRAPDGFTVELCQMAEENPAS